MRKLMLPFIVLIIIILFSIYSCGPYVKQPVASHVVAVTIEGDTILVAIDKIRPNMYYSYYPVYSSYRPNYYNNQYYGYNNYKFRYSDNRGSRGSTGNNKSSGDGIKINPKPINPTPDITSRPSSSVLMKRK